MFEVRIRSKTSKEHIKEITGKLLGPKDIDLIVTGMAKVYKPNGDLLLIYLPSSIPEELRQSAYDILHTIKMTTTNRGNASGSGRARPMRIGLTPEQEFTPTGSHRRSYTKEVISNIIGHMEGSPVAAPEHRYCRLTAWTGRNFEQWQELHPYIHAVAQLFKEYVPERYGAQMRHVLKTNPAWIIPDTPYSTITINNCVDPQTECLTKRKGWIHYSELEEHDILLAYDPITNTTKWEPLKGVFVNSSYHGDMVLLSNSRFSAFVTPNHRWPVRPTPPKKLKPYRNNSIKSMSKRGFHNPMWGKTKFPEYAIYETHELPVSGWGLVRSAPHDGPSEARYPDWLVRLVAWYITEGSYGKTGISISQSSKRNPHFVAEIRRDLVIAGAQAIPEPKVPYVNRKIGVKGNIRRTGFWYNERQANQWPEIRSWGLTGSSIDEIVACAPGKEKVPTMEFLSSLTTQQAAMFVSICLAGDGSKRSQYTSIFSQFNKARMDAFTVAAVLSGMAPSLFRNGCNCSLNESYPLIWLESVKRQTLYYEGPIWCPQLPSGHWVARRNGKTFITGNTYPTGVHTDVGDLQEGFSCLTTLRKGNYTGGLLCFPEFRVGIDMKDGDTILMDAHEFHGNMQMYDENNVSLDRPTETAERISTVLYYRTNMVKCGTMEEELAKAAAIS